MDELAIRQEQVHQESSVALYQGASQLKLSQEEQTKLEEHGDEQFIEIRPDGLIFFPQVFFRERLNSCFGIGQWAIIQHGVTKDPDRDKMYYDGSMIIRGCFVARSIGEAEYHADNKMQSWASVFESAKSDCITRCCKDLGIFKSLWQPQFIKAWKEKYAQEVWVESQKDGKKRKMWRKKSDPPIDQYPYKEQCSDRKPVDKPKSEPEPQSKPSSVKPNDAQIKRLQTIVSVNKMKVEDIKLLLKTRYKVDSSKDLTIEQYNELCGDEEKGIPCLIEQVAKGKTLPVSMIEVYPTKVRVENE